MRLTRLTSARAAVVILVVGLLISAAFSTTIRAADPATTDRAAAQAILDESGVQGGLVVHVGCGNGHLTAAFRANDRYLVHGLDADEKNVAAAREHLNQLGLYGAVSIEPWSGGRLPYADNLVNLIVVEQAGLLDDTEIDRALAPGGVALARDGAAFTKHVKPRPDAIDEWTHFLHGPDNNAVARDTVVGPPERIQWIGGPKWARGHEVLATISAVVTAGGRLYYIVDEGPTASIELPSRWMLVARDAFNGIVLWKRPIPRWESKHRPFRSGPTHLPRRLTAIGDAVYVTLGFGEPVVALDGATGEIRKTYAGTEGTEEILFTSQKNEPGRLYLVMGDLAAQEATDQAVRRGAPLPPIPRAIVCLDAASGAEAWRKSDDDTADLFSQTLAVAGERVFFQNTRAVVALDATGGSQLWRTPRPAALKRPAWSVPTLVVYGDVVLSADRQAQGAAPEGAGPQKVSWTVSFAGGNAPPGELIALNVSTGEKVWSRPCKEGYNAPVDVLLADGLLWTGDLVKANAPGITEAIDPNTGEVKRTRPKDQTYFTPGMSHHRCYRNRATDKFVLLGRSGVELLDLATGKATANHWVRGTCQFGVLPANGLIYVPPHSCACYLKTKLNGFNALAPRATETDSTKTATPPPRLTKGPAFNRPTADSRPLTPEPWPTYRHDAARSGATSTRVPTELKPSWQADVGGDLTAPTIAAGHVFVARKDNHTVYALDEQTGKTAWSFTAGGPIDSPPTHHDRSVLFGSHDGHTYCLDAESGQLKWRLRAAPVGRRVIVEGVLASAWPVHGSVLVQNGVAYFAAGRSTFLDGGIYLVSARVADGKVISESLFSGRDPETGEQPKDIIKGFDMPGGLPDVLSSDGTYLYMRDRRFDDQWAPQAEGGTHLFSPTGYLDDSWWHRSYWILGSEFKAGWGGWHRIGNVVPSGRLLVFDEDSIYGFGRNKIPGGNTGQWKSEFYRLFAASKTPKKPAAAPAPKPKPKADPKAKRRRRKAAVQSTVDYRWQEKIEPEVRAMVLAGGTLFVAGPHGETHKDVEAFQGAQGITLQAISTSDGSVVSRQDLKSLPVFDGMAAANGRLYLSTRDGRVTAFGGE